MLKQLIDYDRFILQLISLAGLHSNAAATGAPISIHMKPLLFNNLLAELAARFKEDGMLAYVQLVQRKEKEINCDVLTHQKWYYYVESHVATLPFTHVPRSGANYIDKILQTVSSGSSSTSAIGKDSTEHTF